MMESEDESPSGRTPASGQEEQGDDRSADTDAAPPPLGVKLTVYRLLNITILFSIGIIKGILTYKGQSTAPTTLDWIGGALLAALLYWIGLYEDRDTKKGEWFFQADLAPAIGYCTKLFVAGVMWPLFFLDGIFVYVLSMGSLLGILTSIILNLCLPHILRSHSQLVGIPFGFLTYGCMVLLWYCVGVLTRRVRVRVWAWQCAIRFVDDYGPGAPLAKRYGWFGAVGTVVGLFFGIALFGSPWVVLVFYF